jgi:Flp pilus assembly protein TadG|uniref:Putative Flp pilus-assembly TadG-like N-terminal domain-containing protein n=1 Tax=Desulfobacca acetoxidans TaxID=60893 RepID=A0A7V6A4W4_9BACT
MEEKIMFVRLRKFVQGTEGTIMVLSALGLVAFLGFASLAIDMGHLYVVRNQLQNVADAAALAGARQLIKEDPSTKLAYVDSQGAHDAALGVAQNQAQLSGLPTVADGDRTDLKIEYGHWDIYAGNPNTAWTATDGSANSDSNAVRVSIKRADGVAFGPVTNFLAGILGYQTSTVSATATAYLGFAQKTLDGGVTLPIALPTDAVKTTDSQEKNSWWAQWLGPREAVAATTKTLYFFDYPLFITPTNKTNQVANIYTNTLQTTIPHWLSETSNDFTTGPINHIANTTKPSPDPLAVGTKLGVKLAWSVGSKTKMPSLEVGQGQSGTPQLYAGSEWKWDDRSTALFDALKKAYTKNKDAHNKWRVLLPVYAQKTAANPPNQGLWRLARFFSFGPAPAYACVQYVPNVQVLGFTVADITAVNYNSSCTQCSSTDLTCLNKDTSCSRTNYAQIDVYPGSSGVAPLGGESGGNDNSHITSGGTSGKGTYSLTDIKLVQ